MSFNQLHYDTCNYTRNLKENVSILGYMLAPFRYEHEKKCRHELGLIGGTAVSHIQGNMVDLESELRGQTRYLTKCEKGKPKPLEYDPVISNDKTKPIETDKKHLPACQMISYRAIPLPPSLNAAQCK